MCMIKVRPEIEETPTVPARVVRHGSTRNSIHGSHRNRSRSSVRGERETTTVIETIKVPPPPPSQSISDTRETHTTIIQAAHHPASAPSVSDMESRHGGGAGHWGDRGSPRASVVSTRSRDVDYYVDSSASYAGRSPRSSYRYVDGNPRGSSQRITDGTRGSRNELEYSGSQRGDRYGYNNFHGRRSGSVSYVNPRHSAVSQRSARSVRDTREKVVVVDEYGRERYY